MVLEPDCCHNTYRTLFGGNQVNRPCHLSNTQDGVPDISTAIAFGGDGAQGLGSTVNGYHYGENPDGYLAVYETGQLVELDVDGLRVHPFHIHTNHFQVLYMEQYSDYHQEV
jgi:FtsP/CotA-like multicopper oxidase with cupredoxin domain